MRMILAYIILYLLMGICLVAVFFFWVIFPVLLLK
jgi:hypothetical protein